MSEGNEKEARKYLTEAGRINKQIEVLNFVTFLASHYAQKDSARQHLSTLISRYDCGDSQDFRVDKKTFGGTSEEFR